MLTGGPHGPVTGYDLPYASLDFKPEGTPSGCDIPTDRWVAAAASGFVEDKGSYSIRIHHRGGWTTKYFHLANIQVNAGDDVSMDRNLGNPSCNGGTATGSHVHFSLLYNGAYQPIAGTLLEGWLVQAGATPYAGCLTKGSTTICQWGVLPATTYLFFNETIGVSLSQLDTVWWFPWYDSRNAYGNNILVGNPGPNSAQVEIYIAGQKTGDSPHTVAASQVWTPKYVDTIGGPVKVISTNGQPILASQRVMWISSTGASPVSSDDMTVWPDEPKTWWFPWYDSTTGRSNNILAGNPGPNPAQVEIYIAGQKTADSPHTIAAGQVWTPKYVGTIGGPVRVVSTGDQPIFVSQRTLENRSLNETMGVPGSLVDTVWWFPWYDSTNERSNNILVGNPGPNSAKVEIYIAGQKTGDSPHTIAAGQVWTPKYVDTIGGPVKVISTNSQPIFASQRVLWTPASGFNETMGVPDSLLDTVWWFPWYDSTDWHRDNVMVANPGPNSAQVEIYIAGQKTSDSPHTIAAGQVWTPRYSGTQGGPVRIVSTNDQPIVVSQRTCWFDSTFNETMGIPQVLVFPTAPSNETQVFLPLVRK